VGDLDSFLKYKAAKAMGDGDAAVSGGAAEGYWCRVWHGDGNRSRDGYDDSRYAL
jgi:hypothetical protein